MEKVRAEEMRWMVSMIARVRRSLKVNPSVLAEIQSGPVESSLLTQLSKVNDTADV